MSETIPENEITHALYPDAADGAALREGADITPETVMGDAVSMNTVDATNQITNANPEVPPAPHSRGGGRTYLIVDGENIDATLGMNVLGHRPSPEERPRWDRIVDFAHRLWGQDVTPLFFLNASSGQMPMPFVQALLAMGYRPIPLAGSASEKVVDIGIQRTLDALEGRDGDVLLASHDGDFIPQVETLLDANRRVGLLCFREFVNARFTELASRGLGFYDLEQDAKAFITLLPRVRIIKLDEFDPAMYL